MMAPMHAVVREIAYHLPPFILTNDTLAERFPEWSVDKIEKKTGIIQRHIAGDGECASDLAVEAVRKLIAGDPSILERVDYLLLCTQSPDYFLPTTACLLQDRIGLPRSIGAMDINLGCSGFVYGLSLAKGLIESDQANCVLLITSETYSKFIHPEDRNVRTIFGDGAAVTLIERDYAHHTRENPMIGPFIFGTDGSGGENLIVYSGAMRGNNRKKNGEIPLSARKALLSDSHLYMNGPEIFKFTMRTIPHCVENLIAKAGRCIDEIDLFVFHQANRYMLDSLRKKIGIPQDKFIIDLKSCANTVSASIPIALKIAQEQGRLKPGMRVMVVGFGVGYSWSAALMNWGAA